MFIGYRYYCVQQIYVGIIQIMKSATRSKSAEIFKFLLTNGVDINTAKKRGPNILQAALLWSPIETVELVIQKLHLDCENQDAFKAIDDIQKCHKIVMFLLDKKIDIKYPKSKFSLLLSFALKFGEEKTFELVLQNKGHDFDIDAVSPYDKNCMLHRAILLNKIPQVHLLLAYGANIELEDSCEFTLLARACQKGRMNLVELLADYGANFNSKNKRTMLHHAVIGANIEIIDLLIRMGLNINAENDYSEPPLCHATKGNAKVQSVPLIEFLIDNGANFDLSLLLDYDTQHPDVVELLLELSDNFKDKDIRGILPLQFFLEFARKITINTELLIAFMTTNQINIKNALKNCYYLHFNGARVDQFYQNCKLEVSRMKNVKFNEDEPFSLYDFLTGDLILSFTIPLPPSFYTSPSYP
ncbi:putative ankyrin repeat protein RF_0381 [Belonocnema kinseyi]|uniref:putative ankyrin repeat protein RF_0381 n=1 Tax=Belonocnema kinseyi TaxID=2817044 RepID=UPI00143CDC91|nr:putative ankyrin repeat protein RF_0381 [Belonocnema kinseyi]